LTLVLGGAHLAVRAELAAQVGEHRILGAPPVLALFSNVIKKRLTQLKY
jgi:hypothetical protein